MATTKSIRQQGVWCPSCHHSPGHVRSSLQPYQIRHQQRKHPVKNLKNNQKLSIFFHLLFIPSSNFWLFFDLEFSLLFDFIRFYFFSPLFSLKNSSTWMSMNNRTPVCCHCSYLDRQRQSFVNENLDRVITGSGTRNWSAMQVRDINNKKTHH